MSGEEGMILSYIQAAGNEGKCSSLPASEHRRGRGPKSSVCAQTALGTSYSWAAVAGIWTKHLKAKTELHQTVIDRCLKSLVQKQLIKAVKSVQVRSASVLLSVPRCALSCLNGLDISVPDAEDIHALPP